MIFGMADPFQQAVLRRGRRLRLYTPVGDLLPGMAYLVRRLLENTSNESFLEKGICGVAAVDNALGAVDGSDAPTLASEPDRLSQ